MKINTQTATILGAVLVFIGLPILIYTLGDAPRRTMLKEVISVTTLLAFAAMLSQFFMARSNTWLLSVFKPPHIQKVHKYIAYTAVGIILLHPVLIVLPRALEGGIRPWDALITLITEFDSLGVVLGLAAWCLMLVLAAMAWFRMPIMKLMTTRYCGWRYVHGALAVTFIVLALWHAIETGRHTGLVMSALYLTLAVIGLAMLATLYRGARPQAAPTQTEQSGAAS